MKKVTFYLAFLVIMLLGLGLVNSPAQAQEPDQNLNTILAQAAAKSFLVTLTRPELASTRNFYLLESVNIEGILAELSEPPVTGFEITEASWASEVSHQVKAVLQPSKRTITIYTAKYNGRWRVEGIELAPTTTPATTSANSTVMSTTPVTTITAGVRPVSANGTGKLVFQTQNGGDIYVINADGTGLRRITHGIDPQLSPDGTQIAFTRWEPNYELFTINLDGSGERSWVQGWRQMKSPTWSADGTRLIFSFQSGGRLNDEYHKVDLLRAAQNEDGVDVPSNARDVEVENGILEYRLPMDANWSLKQINLSTNQLFDPAAGQYSYGPTWHPTDPNLLIYRSKEGVGLYDARTDVARPLTSDFRDRAPVISPDGSRIALSYWQDGHWEIHTMNMDGSNRQRLTETPLTVLADKTELNSEVVAGKERVVPGENPHWNNAAPAWSPDGSKLAFLTDRTGKWEIWIMNADGSDQRPMFLNGAVDQLTFNYAGVDERMISWR